MRRVLGCCSEQRPWSVGTLVMIAPKRCRSRLRHRYPACSTVHGRGENLSQIESHRDQPCRSLGLSRDSGKGARIFGNLGQGARMPRHSQCAVAGVLHGRAWPADIGSLRKIPTRFAPDQAVRPCRQRHAPHARDWALASNAPIYIHTSPDWLFPIAGSLTSPSQFVRT